MLCLASSTGSWHCSAASRQCQALGLLRIAVLAQLRTKAPPTPSFRPSPTTPANPTLPPNGFYDDPLIEQHRENVNANIRRLQRVINNFTGELAQLAQITTGQK